MNRLRMLGSLFPPSREAELPTTAANADHLDDPYYTAFKAAAQPLLLLDERGFFDCNDAAVELFEAESAQFLCALHPADLSPSRQPCGRDSFELADEYVAQAMREERLCFDWQYRTLKGRDFPAEVTMSFFEARGRRVLQASVRDVSAKHEAQRQALERAQLLEQQLAQQSRVLEQRALELARDHDAVSAAERRLAAQNAYFRQLFEAAPLGVVILDRNEIVENVNTAWQEMFGYTLDEVRGRCINDLIVSLDARAEAEQVSVRILSRETVQFHARRLRKDGTLIDVSFIGAPITVGGEQVGIYGIYSDQTNNVSREREFRRQKEVAELTLNAIADAVVRIERGGLIAYVNQAAERLLGLSASELLARNFYEICSFAGDGSNEPITFRSLGERTSMMALPESAMLNRRDGSSVAVEGAITSFRDTGAVDSGGVIVMRDVSERRRAQRELAYKATHDSLTGMYNREEMERRITRAICDSMATGAHSSLLYIDLDQFKVVNDTSGHQAGDRLLRRVADALQGALNGEQTLARLGGDEFAVLLPGLDGARARPVAEALLQTVRDLRFYWQGRLFRVGASIGIAEINAQCGDVARVLAAADNACYAAKDQGRGRVKLANDGDILISQRRLEMDWVSRINQALDRDRFVLYRQEIRRIADNGDDGARHWEVLVRMLDDSGEAIPPDHFIPAAERYGLMPTVDRWVLERVFQRLEGQQGADMYAINVSGTSMSDEGFADFITRCFAKYNVSPRHICFEITETAAAANLEHALQFMSRVRELGCRVSLDDFGSGFSSFTYLKAFEINYLKIDGSFVRDIDTDHVNGVFVESINRIGKSLGIHTIAEYVETDAVLQRLREIGVDSAQGHFLDLPKPWSRHSP